MHARLLVFAALVASPPAFAAGFLSQFPKKAGAPIAGSAVTADLTGEPAVVVAAGNRVQAFGFDGKPIKGFPVVLGEGEEAVGDIAAADLDGDAKAELAIATKSGKLYVISKGGVAPGFPITLPAGCSAGPSFADLDGDGRPEVLQGDRAGQLHVLKANGHELPPFPVKLGEPLTSSPSVGRLRGKLVVAIGSEKGSVYVVDAKGAPLDGFPLATHFTVSGAPAFGDVDDDGQVDLVVASRDFNLYAADGSGKLLEGFPVSTELACSGSPALADLDGDDVLDIAFASTDGQLYAVNGAGKLLKGFPVKLGAPAATGVAVGDLDRDGRPDLLVAARNGKVFAVSGAGKPLPGSPLKVGQDPTSPFLSRLRDGAVVAFVGAADGNLTGLRFDLKASGPQGAIVWAGAAHDAARSSRFFPNPLRYRDLALSPKAPRIDDVLQASWTFFSVDGLAEPPAPISWLRNGQRVKELDGKKEVPARTAKKGERWRFDLQVGQRVVKGPEVTIQDTAPTAPQVRVQPAELSVKGDGKLEVVVPSRDADGDKVTYRVSWLMDGQRTDLTGELLPAKRLKKGQRWTAVVIPFDGQLEGAPAFAEAKVVNTPPGAPKLAMEPGAPRKGQTVAPVLQAPGPDPDGDPVQHHYRWAVNGAPLNDPLAQATLPTGGLKKGDKVSLEVRAYDGKAEGDPWTGEVQLVNTPPLAPKVALLPAEPRAGQALRALVKEPSVDADHDLLTYRPAWTRNGKPYAPAGEAFEVPAADVKKGDRWTVALTPNDGEVDGPAGSAEATVRNTPPTAPRVSLKPEHPTAAGSIEGVIDRPSEDADGDPVKYAFSWTRDEKAVGSGPQEKARKAVTPKEFKKHERIRVVVTPSDGAADGPAGVAEVVVEDAPPGAPVVALEPATPTHLGPLKAVIRTPAPDADGDAIQYRYAWLKNGAPQPFPQEQAEVPASALAKGDHWTVVVRAWDGEVLGPPASASAQVGNAAPPTPKVAIVPAAPRKGQELSALLTEAEDPDGDVLSYRYAWKRNGQPVGLSPQAARVPAEQPRKGEQWTLEVIANDGAADSPAARAEARIANTPPTPPRVALEPEHPTTGGGLELKLVRPSEDVDGDPVKYAFAWSRGGSAFTPQDKSGRVLTAKELKKHERIRVEVTPSDGAENGPVAAAEVEVDDALPTAPGVALEPSAPTHQGPLKAVIRTPATDTDGDALQYRYVWSRNGLAQRFPESQAEVPASELKKGDRWTVGIRAWDGEALGPAASASVEIGNAAPPAPKVAIAPAVPRRGQELRALLTAAVDPDGDPLSYRYTWRRNGAPVTLPPQAGAVPGEQPRKGETWAVDVVANDGTADSKAAHAEVRVANTPPGLPVVGLCDGPVPAGAALEVKVLTPSADADGDAVRYRYEWTVNGQPQAKWSGRTKLGAGDTRKHDRLKVTVTPNDGAEDGAAAVAECEVEDSPPGAPVAVLEPAEPSAESGLKVKVPQAPADRDGDAVSYRYAWTKNGLPFSVGGGGSAVKPGALQRGDELRVVVTSFDGEREGGQATLAVRVKNTPPPAPTVEVTPAQPVTGEKLSCAAKVPATDADGDPVRVHLRWLRNGAPTPLAEDQAELSAGTVKKGERWRCEAWSDDGFALSGKAGAEVAARNSPPGAPRVEIEPEKPATGDELRCRVAAEAVDPDGDPVKYRYQWTRNGKAEALAEPRVPAERVKKGDAWRCTAIASDSALDGPAATADRKVENSPPGAPRIALGPREPKAGQPLTCELVEAAVDPDGDKVEHRFHWFKDGAEQSFAGISREVPGRLVKSKELWSCEVEAFDGELEGPRAASQAIFVP